MSGFYIHGMEMPTSCRDCRFCNGQADTNYGVCAWCEVDGKARDAYTRQDCPLVPVPPHGRLIDEQWLKDAMITTLEALKKNPKMDRQEMHLIAAFDTLRVMVEDAPTIILADKDINALGKEEGE